MSTEKGTMDIFDLNYEIFLIMVEERFNDRITKMDVLEVVNRSYGINKKTKVNMNNYINELARQATILKGEGNILYTFFDITLGIITKKVIKKDSASRILNEMIRNRMCELTGNKDSDFEHKNKN